MMRSFALLDTNTGATAFDWTEVAVCAGSNDPGAWTPSHLPLAGVAMMLLAAREFGRRETSAGPLVQAPGVADALFEAFATAGLAVSREVFDAAFGAFQVVGRPPSSGAFN